MAYIEKPTNKKKLLSIVIPVFNSEKTILRIYERVTKSFKNSNYEVEIIMVEDHSKDKSWENRHYKKRI